MSLITDKVFFNALKGSATLEEYVGDRIYNTSIDTPDEDLLNEPVPYIIITFDGMQNEGITKDSSYEGDTDRVQIGIEITAETREQLGDIAETVRATILSYFENTEDTDDDFDLIPVDYTLSSGPISYDSLKPCFWQVLSYNCDTTP